MQVINQVALAWWSWMGQMFWQASLLIILISIVDILIRKWVWPQVRYAVLPLLLVKLIIPPAWSMPSGAFRRIFPAVEERIAGQILSVLEPASNKASDQQAGLKRESSGLPAVEADSSLGSTASLYGTRSDSGRTKPVWPVFVMWGWIIGMGMFALMLSLRIRTLRRRHREQLERKTIPVWFYELLVRTAQRLKLDRLPAIVLTDEIVTPAVYGLFHPVMLLPGNYLENLSREDAENVLLHELAHLKRGDLWIHGLNLFLHVVCWFNPILIWVGRQIKHVREMCCDMTIANLLREKTGNYRQTLLNTARELLTEAVEPGMGLLGVFEEPFRLVARLNWLKKKTLKQRPWIAATNVLVIGIMVPVVLPMAALHLPVRNRRSVCGRQWKFPLIQNPTEHFFTI